MLKKGDALEEDINTLKGIIESLSMLEEALIDEGCEQNFINRIKRAKDNIDNTVSTLEFYHPHLAELYQPPSPPPETF